MNLDFMPSPVADRPGLLIRDPFGFSDVTLIIPPVLVQMLEYFDGERTEADLRGALYELTGDLTSGQACVHLREALQNAGFLEDETYARLREQKLKEFAAAPARLPAHAGSAYPEDPGQLREVMEHFLQPDQPPPSNLIGVAAPHVSPVGGWPCYRSAYATLPRELASRTFVILGTSHYGAPERFGLTRKVWSTPWGDATPALDLIEELASKAPAAILMEDYVHSVEHSIEFQVVFLQYLFGPNIRILPVLCGAFARSIYEGGLPEDDENVRRFLDVLGEIAHRESDRLFWVLGVDMAHMGRRYGDPIAAQAHQGEMAVVAQRDHGRMERINAGDARGYWELVQERQDDLKWCGSAPFYTFLKVLPEARGRLARYEQWNIDEQSVVSFAGIHFSV